MDIKRYFINLFIAVDQLANTILLGDPDETISSRVGKGHRRGDCKFCSALCWILDKFDNKHCRKSIEEDEGKDAI